jgi:hypothetical protein
VKPFIETLRVTNPVRQSRASSRKRVLRGDGQPSLRSVDSEINRCLIEPRNFLVVSLRLCQMRGAESVATLLGASSRTAWPTSSCTPRARIKGARPPRNDSGCINDSGRTDELGPIASAGTIVFAAFYSLFPYVLSLT